MKTNVYRVAEEVVFRATNRSLIMAFDRKKGVMYECNDTASAVLKLIDGNRSIGDVVKVLGEEYDATEGDLLEDVEEVVQRFEKVGLLIPIECGSGQ